MKTTKTIRPLLLTAFFLLIILIPARAQENASGAN